MTSTSLGSSSASVDRSRHPPLRIGILGAATIARAFVAGVRESTLVAVCGVASRDIAKARKFIDETGLLTLPDKTPCVAYGSYEALLDDPAIDAVYIPLPNNLHMQWAIAATQAGKHVLCEKPLAMGAVDAHRMYQAARTAGVHLVEGYPYQAQAQSRKVRSLLRDGLIGKIQLIQASFGVMFDDPKDIRLDPERGGGALWDIGSYTTSFVRMVAGQRPARVFSTARWGDTGVDLTVASILEHADGTLAQTSCSFATAYHRHGLIVGDNGSIETRWLNHPPLGGPASIELRRGLPVTAQHETLVTETGNGFRLETESFARMIREGKQAWTGISEAESIDTMATIEALLESARTGKWVEPKVPDAAA